MIRFARSTSAYRAAIAAALGLVLAVRLLAPPGFMPLFERGSVTIVACPDAQPSLDRASGHHHDSDHPKKLHQSCPYASASALGGLVDDLVALATVLVVQIALVLGRAWLFVERQRSRERPPLRGPPLFV